jgi:hypothetical protein
VIELTGLRTRSQPGHDLDKEVADFDQVTSSQPGQPPTEPEPESLGSSRETSESNLVKTWTGDAAKEVEEDEEISSPPSRTDTTPGTDVDEYEIEQRPTFDDDEGWASDEEAPDEETRAKLAELFANAAPKEMPL